MLLLEIDRLQERSAELEGSTAQVLRDALGQARTDWSEKRPRKSNDFIRARAQDLRTGVVVQLREGHDYDLPDDAQLSVRSYHGPRAKRTEISDGMSWVQLVDVAWLLIHREDRR